MARKENKVLKNTRQCAFQMGIKPFKKWTMGQKKAVRACVAKKMARAK